MTAPQVNAKVDVKPASTEGDATHCAQTIVTPVTPLVHASSACHPDMVFQVVARHAVLPANNLLPRGSVWNPMVHASMVVHRVTGVTNVPNGAGFVAEMADVRVRAEVASQAASRAIILLPALRRAAQAVPLVGHTINVNVMLTREPVNTAVGLVTMATHVRNAATTVSVRSAQALRCARMVVWLRTTVRIPAVTWIVHAVKMEDVTIPVVASVDVKTASMGHTVRKSAARRAKTIRATRQLVSAVTAVKHHPDHCAETLTW